MEPADIVPLHSSFPAPQPADEGDGKAGSDEEPSSSPLGFADSCDSSTSPRQLSPTVKPAAHQPSCGFAHPVKQSQPTCSVHSGRGQDYDAEMCVHITNGYSDGAHPSGNLMPPSARAPSPMEETGFADFTVFTDQEVHPWCCGFAPVGGAEEFDGRSVGTKRLGGQIYDPEQEGRMDSEPRPGWAYEVGNKDCTTDRHCEKRGSAPAPPSQDHHQSQETAAAFLPEEPDFGEEGSSMDSQRCRRPCVHGLVTSEVQDPAELKDRGDQEKSAVFQTFSMYESVSEDLASSFDDLSVEGLSADLEPNVSSLGSEGSAEWDQTDQEEEELENYSYSDSFISMTKTETGLNLCDPSASQESSATSSRSHSASAAEGNPVYLRDCHPERDRNPGPAQTADPGVLILGTLPPSDSFADFCAAPMQDSDDGQWAEFTDQRVQVEGRSSMQSMEQASLSCRVQRLLLDNFPEQEQPAGGVEEEVLSLGGLLRAHQLPESEEKGEEMQPLCSAPHWIQKGMWWLQQDLHSADGLRFHWGGSHSNRSLLRCLGVDTENTGILEPAKDSMSAACSPEHKAVAANTPPELQDTPVPATDSVQVALSSSQLDWSSRGLSSSQDGTSPRRAPHFWGRK